MDNIKVDRPDVGWEVLVVVHLAEVVASGGIFVTR